MTIQADPRRIETPPAGADVPRRATDVELIGPFEDSGFKQPPYIVRRRDGQVVQLAPLLYALAEEVDGRRDSGAIAEALSHRIRRRVTAENVEMLLDEQLRPLGLVAGRDDKTAEVQKVDPLLALKFRARVVPERVVHAITTVFAPLFTPAVMVAVVAGLIGLDAWLFLVHGISQSIRHVLYQPALLVLILGGVVVATAFHEIGHASAVRYGGARPGVMGVGIYIVWPAFYTDITDAYRLGKWGRLRADVGGMYFNAIFALLVGGAYAVTGFEPLLLLIVLQNFAIVQQSLPFLRLDGFYVISDLTGVPDMLLRIRPVLASLMPWRTPDRRVTELKPWVRVVVTGYVLVIVPAICLMFALMLVHAPRVFATVYDSIAIRWDRVGSELGRGRAGPALMNAFQMLVLVLPCLGMVYTTGRIGHRSGRGVWRWSATSRVRRSTVIFATGVAVGALAVLWWPTADYRPIQPGERGTLTGGLRDLPSVASGDAAAVVPARREAGAGPAHRRHGRHGGRRSDTVQGRSGPTDGGWTWSDSPSAPSDEPPDLFPFGTAPAPGGPSPAPPPPASAPQPAPAPTETQPAPAPTQTTPTQTETTPTQTETTPTQTETTPTQTETTPTQTETTPTQTETTTTQTETTPTQTTTTETTP